MYLGWGYALRGDFKSAYNAISSLENILPVSLPAWLNQAWLLAKADTLLLLGRNQEAHLVGSAAIGLTNPVLHSAFFAGMFARWLALTSLRTTKQASALAQIEQMKLHLSTFDALDQLEILCSAHLLRANRPERVSAAPEPILEKLAHLPEAAAEQMIRLEMLAS